MGWDITYHPIKETEICSVYFKGLQDPEHYKAVALEFDVNEFYTEKLESRFKEARAIEKTTPFNSGHAYYIAIISGFLRKHYYIRGAAFSFMADDNVMAAYIGDWRALVPEEYRDCKFDNCLTENYCGGVFLSNQSLKDLRRDYDANPVVREKMDDIFSHGRLEIFWRAVDDAIENGLALIEATEVVEPNPLNLDATSSLSNLFNCDPAGALLYAEAAMEQIKELTKNMDPVPEIKEGIFKKFIRMLKR